MATTSDLNDMKLTELRELAKQMHLRGTSAMNKADLLATLQAARNGGIAPKGVSVHFPEDKNNKDNSTNSDTRNQEELSTNAVLPTEQHVEQSGEQNTALHNSGQSTTSQYANFSGDPKAQRRGQVLRGNRSQNERDDNSGAIEMMGMHTQDMQRSQDMQQSDRSDRMRKKRRIAVGGNAMGNSAKNVNNSRNNDGESRSNVASFDDEALLEQLDVSIPMRPIQRRRMNQENVSERQANSDSGQNYTNTYDNKRGNDTDDDLNELDDILATLHDDHYEKRDSGDSSITRTRTRDNRNNDEENGSDSVVLRRRGRNRLNQRGTDREESVRTLRRNDRNVERSDERGNDRNADRISAEDNNRYRADSVTNSSAGQNDSRGSSRRGSADYDRANYDNQSRQNRNFEDDMTDQFDQRDQADMIREEELVESVQIAGIVDVMDSYAFIRTSGYLPGANDVYVSMGQIKKYGLRKGDAVLGTIKPNRDVEKKNQRQKFMPLQSVIKINDLDVEVSLKRPHFAKLTPLYPQERLRQETTATNTTGRLIDLIAPIGKGQRGMIVSPPKAGKTLTLQSIAKSITANNPEVHLMVVLVDERPEEVTDMERTVEGEVISSTFDRPATDHTMVAELAIERAKRLVELGHDVVVLLDSMTRLARAYNLAAPTSGRVLSGGVDAQALYPPKKFFGAARNIENGGSLTIISSALVETGSKMDEVIFEEFKGTGNMELRLSRDLADKRLFPAIDINSSGTRREELITPAGMLPAVYAIRRLLGGMEDEQAYQTLVPQLKKTKNNNEFLAGLAGKIAQMNS